MKVYKKYNMYTKNLSSSATNKMATVFTEVLCKRNTIVIQRYQEDFVLHRIM